MRAELRRPWPAVREGESLSYGGNQNWFSDENFRRCGCGVIACADALLYLRGQSELPREQYIDYVNQLRKFFPLIPRRGIDGMRLAVGLNLCLRRGEVPVRARWGASGVKFRTRLEEQLARDLPVIAAVGPPFPRFWSAASLPLYRRTEAGGYVRSARVRAHFVAVTGLDETWMQVSSWGERLYLERGDYERYMRSQSIPLFTNLMTLTEKAF